MTQLVETRTEGNVAVVTMDDGKVNAFSHDMIAQLNAALDEAEKADAVVIAGRAGRFSAGFDLETMMSGPEGAKKLLTEGAHLCMRVYGLPRPVVMAVTGHAIAAGVFFAATGDVRIGIEGDFKLGLNEVSNGMPVPILAHRLAQDRLSPQEFVPAVLHARIYSPEGAVRAGWLDRVVVPDELITTALAEAGRMGEWSNFAYATTKTSIRQASIDHILSTLEENLDVVAEFAS